MDCGTSWTLERMGNLAMGGWLLVMQAALTFGVFEIGPATDTGEVDASTGFKVNAGIRY